MNDNRPIFSPHKYNVTLKSDSLVHGPILRVIATDLDAGLFGQVAYRISSGNEAGIFRIDRNTGELHVMRSSLLSRSPLHQLNVTATDAAGLKSVVDAEVKITVSTASHRIATCEKPRYTVTVKESIPHNTVVGGVRDIAATSSSASTGTRRRFRASYARLSPFLPFLSRHRSCSRVGRAPKDHYDRRIARKLSGEPSAGNFTLAGVVYERLDRRVTPLDEHSHAPATRRSKLADTSSRVGAFRARARAPRGRIDRALFQKGDTRSA